MLHENGDKDRFSVCRHSASADLSVAWLLISHFQTLNFKLSTADEKGAYMHSGPIARGLYLGPPRAVASQCVFWKLLRLLYGIFEAVRQWLCAVEHWIQRKFDVQKTMSIDQLFYKRGEDVSIILCVTKVVDDFLVSGSTENTKQFFAALNSKFALGRKSTRSTLKILGCFIRVDPLGHVITMSMEDHTKIIAELRLSRNRTITLDEPVSESEPHTYQSSKPYWLSTLFETGRASASMSCCL